MDGPKVLVLSGIEATERSNQLINAMVRRPNGLDDFGHAVVDLMADPYAPPMVQADILQPLLKQFLLDAKDFPNEEGFDPGFDQRIMFEAATYAAKMFANAFRHQVPGHSVRDYRFSRWLGRDLVLERRGSL